MGGYTKLFSRLLDSTVWREDDKTRILWITMLALANQDGYVLCTIPGLADRARISLEECELALAKFQQPDKYSWSKEEEGRKIRVIDGGWFLINHAKYRALMSEEDRREKTRVRVAKWRENLKSNASVTECNASNYKQKHIQKQKHIAEAEESTPFSLLSESSGNGSNGKADHRHKDFKELIFKCYQYLNKENPPWDASDAKQLSSLIKAKPDLDREKFHTWLLNYAESQDINPADRPRKFIPRLPSYAGGVLNKFGRPDDAK